MIVPQIIPVRYGEVILCSKGFVLAKLTDDNKIQLQDAKEMIACGEELTGGDHFVTMIDGGLTLDIDEDAMLYSAKYKNDNWKAFAIVVRTISERIFANYYLKFKKPVRPTKVFSSPEKAIEWLKGYLEFNDPDLDLMYKPGK